MEFKDENMDGEIKVSYKMSPENKEETAYLLSCHGRPSWQKIVAPLTVNKIVETALADIAESNGNPKGLSIDEFAEMTISIKVPKGN